MKSHKILKNQDLVRARLRLVRMHYESGVGHLGGNLSALDAMLVVFHEYLNEEDEFILSKGHSAGALYVSLWSCGYLTDADLETFHGENTLLAAHPPANRLPRVSFATGSLGHGLSLAAGTALAFRMKGVDQHVYCLTSDGEWQEGSTWEAMIFARHHRLDNLTILVDHNRLQGFGDTTSVASMAPLADRLSGFDFDIRNINGHDPAALREALRESASPRFIILDTVKGHGVSFMENQMPWHYLPLSEQQYQQALVELAN